MPFTLAHPAAALPLQPLLGSAAAPAGLAIGSMAPDLAFFLPLSVSRAESHSLAGLLWFCLPLGLVANGRFFWRAAPLASALAPGPVAARLPPHWRLGRLPERAVWAAPVSVLVGALTHVVWDAFTHGGGPVMRALPWLTTPLFTWEGYTLFVFKVLQHGSTALGFALLASWGLRWLRETPPRAEAGAGLPWRIRGALLAALLGPGLAVGLAAGRARMNDADGLLYQLQLFTGGAVMAGGETILLTVAVGGVLWRVVREAPALAQ